MRVKNYSATAFHYYSLLFLLFNLYIKSFSLRSLNQTSHFLKKFTYFISSSCWRSQWGNKEIKSLKWRSFVLFPSLLKHILKCFWDKRARERHLKGVKCYQNFKNSILLWDDYLLMHVKDVLKNCWKKKKSCALRKWI